MNKKNFLAMTTAVTAVLIMASVAVAAPLGNPVAQTAVLLSEGVNLPGWVGALLLLLALLLPLAALRWLREK